MCRVVSSHLLLTTEQRGIHSGTEHGNIKDIRGKKWKWTKSAWNERSSFFFLSLLFTFLQYHLRQWEQKRDDQALGQKPNTTLSPFHCCCCGKNTLTKSNTAERGYLPSINSRFCVVHHCRRAKARTGSHWLHLHSRAQRIEFMHAYCSIPFFYSYSSGPNHKMALRTLRMSLFTSVDQIRKILHRHAHRPRQSVIGPLFPNVSI